MTVQKISKLLAILCLCSYSMYGQQWHAGDTLNTVKKDTARIDLFRGNTMNYTGQDLVDASFPNSWPIFGSKARMAIGGYVKLDYIQDFDGSYDRFQYEIQNVPVEGDGRPAQSGYMNLFARESRLNIDFRSITETGMPIQVFFEFDFYNLDRGPFNQSARLRHFYGVLGRLLIGRTWGTQSDLYAVPATIDFAAGDALTGTRRAQIRFEDAINTKFKYAVALEMLEFPGIDGRSFEGQASQKLPLLTGRITKTTNAGGRLFLGASLFQLRWDGEEVIPNSTKVGWGFSFSGREYFGDKKHWFRWMTSYGQGWGSQIIATLGTQSSGILNDEGKLETMPAWNLGTGVCINLSKTLVTNLNVSYYAIDPSKYRDESKMISGSSGHLNLIWSPIKNVNTGVEFMVLERVNGDDTSGVGKRLQFMVKYLF
ncbi:DcaP family trimeric outer membrane transporter [Lutibacter sp. HS1-25]|uniref:DcaP family trimeric outer membrane transporter n=1 Tax=Lutibacter sp. HS1-25 TaxID=2485000 RepID=UPI0010101C0B|nr:DcaP family trimeric outer membrane transporter [Lutibacter sp. HS1-25]